MMVSIWRGVAEDFAPWDVDVTTEDPGLEGLRKTNATDMDYGIRVVFGSDKCTDWHDADGCGGVAYSASFSWDR